VSKPRLVAIAFLASVALVGPASAVDEHVHVPQQPPQTDELLPPILSPLHRPFDAPPNPFAAGHRGVDLEVAPGVSELAAPISGQLTTGVVSGNRYVTIERTGMRVTLSYLSASLVLNGAQVTAGEPVARAGTGHPESSGPSHTHFSLRIPAVTDPSGWVYVDPMPYFRRYLRRVRSAVTVAEPARP
jgi:murein DD-endopeptidase MepM/ murein hydrolase activator NlpD